jgi:translation elongation factor EF-1beta
MIIEYKVMPDSEAEVEYEQLEKVVRETVEKYDESVVIKECEPQELGFGMKAVRVKFQMNEDLGSDKIEEQLSALEEVGELECTLMDRL